MEIHHHTSSPAKNDHANLNLSHKPISQNEIHPIIENPRANRDRSSSISSSVVVENFSKTEGLKVRTESSKKFDVYHSPKANTKETAVMYFEKSGKKSRKLFFRNT